MKDSGYLLSYIRYGDHDAILHCFTKENGFRSFFVKGIYSVKSKKKAYLTPLNELTFIISEHSKGLLNIKKIEQVKSIDNGDVRASSMVFFIAEFLYQVLKSETKQDIVYSSIGDFLMNLEKKNYHSHYAFMISFLAMQGIVPLANGGDYLNPETGCFENDICHHLFNKDISEIWKTYLTEEVYNVRVKTHLKSDFLDTILLYYAHHFPNFRFPKSLDILKEIFD